MIFKNIPKKKFNIVLAVLAMLIFCACVQDDYVAPIDPGDIYFKDTFYLKDTFLVNSINNPIDIHIQIPFSEYDSFKNYIIRRSFRNDTLLQADTVFPRLFLGQKVNDSVFVTDINDDSVVLAYPIRGWFYLNGVKQNKILGINQYDYIDSIKPPPGFRYLDNNHIFSIFQVYNRTNLINAEFGKAIWSQQILDANYGYITIIKSNYMGFELYQRSGYNLAFFIKVISTQEAINTIKSKEFLKIN
ncbi:MAG: hypothetical protein QM539_05810 [Alphaproteobacteria bacterium]|nr:hypothetical protein [Alphaproteobacteria bacterium]